MLSSIPLLLPSMPPSERDDGWVCTRPPSLFPDFDDAEAFSDALAGGHKYSTTSRITSAGSTPLQPSRSPVTGTTTTATPLILLGKRSPSPESSTNDSDARSYAEGLPKKKRRRISDKKLSDKKWTPEWDQVLSEAFNEYPKKQSGQLLNIVKSMERKKNDPSHPLYGKLPAFKGNKNTGIPTKRQARDRLICLEERQERKSFFENISLERGEEMTSYMHQIVSEEAPKYKDPKTNNYIWKDIHEACCELFKTHFSVPQCPFERNRMKNTFFCDKRTQTKPV